MCLCEDEILDRLFFPSSILFVGSSGSGKTTLVLDMIRNRNKIFAEEIDKVVYVYAEDQESFHQLALEDPKVIFTKNIEDIESLIGSQSILVFDDKLLDFTGKQNDFITKWFIQKSHHLNVSVWVQIQCLFGKNLRVMSLNCTYLALFNLIRDVSSISRLASQFCPGM